MRVVFALAALFAVYCAVESTYSPPKVQVYSYKPGHYGKENILICHVSDFHPPDISIQLLKGDAELPFAEQTDLAFKQNWHFHLTKNVAFTPMEGETYRCRVTHGSIAKDYAWESSI